MSILSATFPDDLDQVRYFLSRGITRVYCQQCGQTSPYNSSALCFVPAARSVLIYVPGEVADAHPEIVENLRPMLEAIVAGIAERGITITTDVTTDPEVFRRDLAQQIGKLAAPVLASFPSGPATDTTSTDKWVGEWESRLARPFFASCALILENLIPFYGIVVPDSDALDAPDFRNKLSALGPFYVIVVSSSGEATEKDILEEIRRRVREIVVLAACRIAQRLALEDRVGAVASTIAQLMDVSVLDDLAVTLLAHVVGSQEENDSTPGPLNYAYHAVLAAVCDMAGKENPRLTDWAGWYVSFELYRRRDGRAPEFEGWAVPPDFALRTITPEGLWDQLGPRFQTSLEQGDEAEVDRILDLVWDLDLTEDWDSWTESGLTPILDNLSDEALDQAAETIRDIAVKNPDSSSFLITQWLRGLMTRDTLRALVFGARTRKELLETANESAAIWTGCKLVSVLNERGFHGQAKHQIEALKAELKTAGFWPPTSIADLIAVMTEEGNCLRYLGDAAGALQIYDECRALLPSDMANANVRTNERNRAIALREFGSVTESLTILRSLLPHTRSQERAITLHSIAGALATLGREEDAGRLLERALAELHPGKMSDPIRLSMLIELASHWQKSGAPDIALAAGYEAFGIAREQHNLWAEALAIGLTADAASDVVEDPAQRKDVLDLAIKVLGSYARMPEQFRPGKAWDIPLQVKLADLLEARGDATAAEELLKRLAERSWVSADNHQWVVWAKLALIARKSGNTDAALEHLARAEKAVTRIVGALDPKGDPFTLMIDKVNLQRLMGDEFGASWARGDVDAAALRAVADFQSSLVLSGRVPDAMLDEESPDGAGDGEPTALRIEDLAEADYPREIAVLHVLEGTSELRLVLTRIGHGSASCHVVPLTLGSRTIRRLVDQVSYKLAMWSPADNQDPLKLARFCGEVRAR